MWRIESIQKCMFPEKHLLPRADFVLTNGDKQVKVSGWLPCHHTNVVYDLEIRHGRIIRVYDLKIDKSIKQKTKAFMQAYKRMTKKKADDAETYKAMAKASYTSTALWTCTVLYTHWELRQMNLESIFKLLTKDIETVVDPDSKASRPRFLFQPVSKTKVFIQKALRQMGEIPYNDWEGFQERRAWYIQMSNDTASRKKPSKHIRRLECYQDLWTTSCLIEEARILCSAFRSDNVTLVEGSPCPRNIPKDVCVVFKNLEDIYKWKCEVDYGHVFVMSMPFKPGRLTELGVGDASELKQNQNVYVPWAHTWGQRNWLTLSTFKPTHVTAIGRLDQWPSGRGQLFRDMLHSKKFDTSRAFHAAADHVQHIDTDDIVAFVSNMVDKHKVVQCFSESGREDIDCGRRWLTHPKRIRTLRNAQEKTLFEEDVVRLPDRVIGNASVVPIRSYSGLKVPASIYLCTDQTTAFDVHVARTFTRNMLYIVNCRTCLFSMQKQAPKKCTINPFI
jgi:hypothetical protein